MSRKLRAHHGMCLSFFEGKGYSHDFTAHMQRIWEEMKSVETANGQRFVEVKRRICERKRCISSEDTVCSALCISCRYVSSCSIIRFDTDDRIIFSRQVPDFFIETFFHLTESKRAVIGNNHIKKYICMGRSCYCAEVMHFQTR